MFRLFEHFGYPKEKQGLARPVPGGPISDTDELHAQIQQSMVWMIAHLVLFNHAVSQQVGLGASDSQFMTLLRVRGAMTPGELARHTGLPSGTVTGVVDRLERSGFVRRERDAHDRRKVLVRVDEAAVGQRMAPLYQAQAEHLQSVLRSRTPAQLTVIAQFLADVAPDTAS